MRFSHLVLIAALLWSAIAYGQCNNRKWVLLADPPSPNPNYSAIAYDSARDRVVIFGGITGMQTWEFDGQDWAQLHVPGPARGGAASLAYDSVAGHVVLFGGHPATSSCGYAVDTWFWSGTQWTLGPTSGPPGREGAAMAFDPVRNRTVLFGGVNCSAYLADTWEFDGIQWQQIVASGPSDRTGARMVYDPDHQVTLLFGGGQNNGSSLQDLWSWDGVTWTLLAYSGPYWRRNAVFVHDPQRHRIVMSNGIDGALWSDYWEWNGATWTELTAAEPTRGGTLGVYDTARHRLLTFGKPPDNTLMVGDTWSWNGAAWTLLKAGLALTRTGHMMAYDAVHDQVVIYGGDFPNMYSQPLGDTLTWSPSAGWRTAAPTGPPARRHGAMVYDAAIQRVVLYGGVGPSIPSIPSTWLWNGTVWQANGTGPSARFLMAATYDSVRGRIVMYGGTSDWYTPLNETWEYNGSTWVQITGPAATPLMGVPMSYDPWRSQTVMVGGGDQGYVHAYTWRYTDSAWSQANFSGPIQLTGDRMAPGPGQRMIVYAPGNTSSRGTDEWDGQNWTIRQGLPGPTAGTGYAMIYDSFRDITIIQGGAQVPGADTESLWAYMQTGPARIVQQPRPIAACPGQQVSISLVAVSADPVQYQWRRDAAPIQGVTGPSLTLTATAAALGIYDCILTNTCGTTTSDPVQFSIKSADFNGDGDTGTDQDIEAFFACLAGDCCATCGSADFNGDGDIGTDADITTFFRVLGGVC